MKRRAQGFTLIELMMVVTVIGILASLAVPAFQGFLIKTKKSERKVLIENLRRNAEASFNERSAWENSFPGLSSFSYTFADTNPPFPVTGAKRPWDRSIAGWSRLGFEPSGETRFSYYFFGYQSDSYGMYQILTYSDLDGNGILETHQETWVMGSTGFELDSTYDDPPEG